MFADAFLYTVCW